MIAEWLKEKKKTKNCEESQLLFFFLSPMPF